MKLSFFKTKALQKILIICVVFSFLATVTVFAHGGEDHGAKVTSNAKSYPKVTIVQPKDPQEFSANAEVSGVVMAKNQTDIFSKREGIITGLQVDIGDVVKKGQVVASLSADKDSAGLYSEIAYYRQVIKNLNEKQIPFEKSSTQADIVTLNQEIKMLGSKKKILQKNFDGVQTKNLDLEYETQKIQNNLEKSALQKQIEILDQQIVAQKNIVDNKSVDAMYIMADTLFINRKQILKKGSRISPRPEFILEQNKVSFFSREFQNFYRSFFAAEEISDAQRKKVYTYAKKIREFSASLTFVGGEGLSLEEIKEIQGSMDDVIDDLAEVENNTAELVSQKKSLEAEILQLDSQNSTGKLFKTNSIKTLEGENAITLSEIDFEIAAKKSAITQQVSKGELSISQVGIEIAEAQAQIKRLQSQIGWGSQVTAPFSGVISKRYVNVGESVGMEKPLFTIINEDEKFIRFHIPEGQLPFVEEGKEISFSPTSSPSQKFVATISRIGLAIDPQSRKVVVEADITKGEVKKILSNMNVRVYIPFFTEEESKNLLVIPEKSLEISNNTGFVWTVNADVKLEKTPVSVSFIYEGDAYIEKKSAENLWIVVKSPVTPTQGLEVESKLAE